MGVVRDDSLEVIVRFYLDSGIIFYYNNNTGKLSYKIYRWKVTIEKGFEYDNDTYNLWGGEGDDENVEFGGFNFSFEDEDEDEINDNN